MNSELAPSMHSFKLYGAAREQFGEEFRMHVTTLTEAFRGLQQMVKGFGQFVRESEFRIVLGDRDTGIVMVTEQVGAVLPVGCDVHVVPVLRGSGSGMGIGKIIIGAILVVASFYAGGTAGWAYFGSEAAANAVASATLAVGMSVALSGVSTLISPQAKATQQQQQQEQNSFNFSGVQNTNAQGVAVPVVYGEFEVGSVLISAGISTQQLMN